jgi:cation diffusion facilitator family transporter
MEKMDGRSTCPLEPAAEAGHARRQEKAAFVVNIGLALNALLAAGKLGVGIFGHSRALLADGVNSISDVAYFLVVMFFVRLSGKPADSEHPYGHYQYESIAALVVGAFIITTGFAIFWDSVNDAFDLMTGETEVVAVSAFALYTAMATIVVKIALMIQARSVGRATSNLAVIAIARDHRNDIFASLGAATGILLAMLGIQWADPLAGAVVAIFVAKTGLETLREAADDLMDSVPSRDLAGQIKAALADETVVRQIEEIHAHRFGPYFVANITICVEGSLSVAEADVIATSAEKKLLQRISMLRKVYVHTHPAGRCSREERGTRKGADATTKKPDYPVRL